MIAHDQMVKGRKDLLIVILKENINVDKLPADLRVYVRKLNCLQRDSQSQGLHGFTAVHWFAWSYS